MKTLILTAFLVLTTSAFAFETHDVDCTAFDTSDSIESVNISNSSSDETVLVKTNTGV